MMTRFQLFIHRNYDSIKLILMVTIFILTVVAVIGQIQESAKNAVDREEAVAELLENQQKETTRLLDEEKKKTDEIIRNQEKQTAITCVLFKTSTATEQVLTEEERQLIIANCEQEIDRFDNPTGETEQEGSQAAAQVRQGQSNPSSKPTPKEENNQPENVQTEPEETNPLRRAVEVIVEALT